MSDMSIAKLTAPQILTICDDYRHGDYIDSLDRAELMRHFGGGCLNPECDELGLVGDNNWLMGYKYLNKAFRQLFGLYTSDAGIVEIKVKQAITPDRRRIVERVANSRVNQVIRESRRFRYPYWSACGDAVIYGAPYLYRWNPHDWCPQYAGKPLMPRNAPADVNDPSFSRWAFPGELSGKDIMSMLKRAERSTKRHWNTRGLRAALKQLVHELDPDKDHMYNTELDQDDPEKIEQMFQTNAIWNDVLGSEVKVYYFYQKQMDGSVDVYIINRLRETIVAHETGVTATGATATIQIDRKGDSQQGELFFQPRRFKDVSECIFPMLLDVKFGGKAMAHRILGLGRLNYDLDRMVSQLINSGLAGLEEDFTPLYQAEDTASLQKLEQMIKRGVARGSVFPSDIKSFERKSNARNYSNLFAFIQSMDVAQGSNASAHAATTSGSKGSKELEVVALERQQENAQNVTTRMEDWAEMGQPLAEMMVRTLTGRGTMVRGDRGFPERERLEELLAEDGVLIEELDPALLTVRFRRHLGAGDSQIRLIRAEKKLSMVNQYPPESQRIILREWTEAVDESYERANELVPFDDPPNISQLQNADAQTALAVSTGVTPQPGPTDIPEIHAARHMQSAMGIVQANQGSGLDPSATNGMAALLEHLSIDIQMIASRGNVALAKQFSDQLGEISKAAQQIAIPTPPPKEQVEMELKQRSQALQEQKRADAVAKQQRAQDHRESADQQRLSLQMHSEARKDREMALKETEAMRDDGGGE